MVVATVNAIISRLDADNFSVKFIQPDHQYPVIQMSASVKADHVVCDLNM